MIKLFQINLTRNNCYPTLHLITLLSYSDFKKLISFDPESVVSTKVKKRMTASVYF